MLIYLPHPILENLKFMEFDIRREIGAGEKLLKKNSESRIQNSEGILKRGVRSPESGDRRNSVGSIQEELQVNQRWKWSRKTFVPLCLSVVSAVPLCLCGGYWP